LPVAHVKVKDNPWVRRGDVALHRLYQNIRTLQRSTLNIPSV